MICNTKYLVKGKGQYCQKDKGHVGRHAGISAMRSRWSAENKADTTWRKKNTHAFKQHSNAAYKDMKVCGYKNGEKTCFQGPRAGIHK